MKAKFKKLASLVGNSNKVTMVPFEENHQNDSNSIQVGHNKESISNWASPRFDASNLPFADDEFFWGNDPDFVKIHNARKEKMHDFLSRASNKVKKLLKDSRDMFNPLQDNDRIAEFERTKLYAKNLLALGYQDAIEILKDIYGKGLKIGPKTLCEADSSEFNFWQEIGSKLCYADGFKAGYTNSATIKATMRAASFVIMSTKAHNTKVVNTGKSAADFLSNFDTVMEGGRISEEVIQDYRDGIVRNIMGENDDIFTE